MGRAGLDLAAGLAGVRGSHRTDRVAHRCAAPASVGSSSAVNGLPWMFVEPLFRDRFDPGRQLARELEAVGVWYRNFPQVGDEEVLRLLSEPQAPELPTPPTPGSVA